MHYKEDNMPELKNSTASILKRLADEGKISLNEKEYATIAGFDEEVDLYGNMKMPLRCFLKTTTKMMVLFNHFLTF